MNVDKTLVILLIVVLVMVGPSQLPKIAKMFGQSAKALKDGIDGTAEDEKPAATVPASEASED